ncbi:MAG: hypothetical protein ACI9MR_004403 [Myxococcota bacterium]|jgi:hypothetical protein
MIRTGSLTTASEFGTTEVRQLPRRKREENWREVRVGFARGLDDADKTYVARMEKYPVVANQLSNAAVTSGLSSDTEVFAVSDGGHRLREELDANFSGLTFLLDRPHLKQHLFGTTDALGLDGQRRSDWVSDVLLLIDEGHVVDVIETMESHQGIGHERTRRLSTYLARFADAVDFARANTKRAFPLARAKSKAPLVISRYPSEGTQDRRRMLVTSHHQTDARPPRSESERMVAGLLERREARTCSVTPTALEQTPLRVLWGRQDRGATIVHIHDI